MLPFTGGRFDWDPQAEASGIDGLSDPGWLFRISTVLTLTGGNLPGSMRLTFLVSLVGIALLYVTFWKYEMAAKSTRMQVRALRRALLGEDSVSPLKRSAAPS